MITLLCTDFSAATEEDYRCLLQKASPERRERALGFARRRDALACLCAGALLELALEAADAPREGLTLTRGPQGKPAVTGAGDFHFSLSHSHPWAAIAWGSSPVGLDVERENRSRPLEALARRCLSPEELEGFLSAPDRAAAFYTLWTAKESCLKYLGTGIDRPLYAVSPGEAAASGLRFHHRKLDGTRLCLCTREADIALHILPLRRLLEVTCRL